MRDRSLQCESCGAQQGISPTGNCVVCGGDLAPTSSPPSSSDRLVSKFGEADSPTSEVPQPSVQVHSLPPSQRTITSPLVVQPTESAEGYALASLVLGILGGFGISAILAIIFGNIALNRIRESSGILKGRTMAIAGVALGWVGIALTVIILIVISSN